MRMALLPLAAGAALIAAAVGGTAELATGGQEPNWFNGDANCDGSINSVDAAVVLQFDAGLLDALTFPDGGDSDKDGSINSADALLILQFDAGLMPNRTPNACISIPPGPGPS